MSSLVHLGRAAIARAQLTAAREREAVRRTLVPAEGPDRRERTSPAGPTGQG